MSKYSRPTHSPGVFPENNDQFSLSSDQYYGENGKAIDTINKKGRINFKAVLLDKKRQRSKMH